MKTFVGNVQLISAMVTLGNVDFKKLGSANWKVCTYSFKNLSNVEQVSLWFCFGFLGEIFWISQMLSRLSILHWQGVASLRSLSLAAAQNWSILKIHPNYFYTNNLFAVDPRECIIIYKVTLLILCCKGPNFMNKDFLTMRYKKQKTQ